jgi:hypothetical protein
VKFILLALTLGLVGIIFTSGKKGTVARKMESTSVRFEVKDFPEHGIFLITPSNPSFTSLEAKLTNHKGASIAGSYSVFLKNTGKRAVVGYRIKWGCIDSRGEAAGRDVSNIVSWIFLHGEEDDRRRAVKRSAEVINPGSTWFISFGVPERPVEGSDADATLRPGEFDESEKPEPITECASVTVVADGLFFDDGTFVGPDTTDFFTEVSSQLDARYEILRGVRDDLAAGKKPEEIFKGLELIRDRNSVRLGDRPTRDEFLAYFRSLFAQDVLGTKELRGAGGAFEEVQSLLSKPWVKLRKL